MATQSINIPIPKIIALAVVSLGIALWFKHSDSAALASLPANASSDYIQHEQKIHGHSVLIHTITFGAVGFVYLVAIDLVAYLVRSVTDKPTSMQANQSKDPAP